MLTRFSHIAFLTFAFLKRIPVGHFAVDALVNDPNDMRMVISRDGDVMAVVMQTNGVQFFDISEPTMPRPLSEVYTIETDGGLPFTEGVLDAKEGVPGQWFLLISQNGMTASILEVAIGELEATPGQEDDSLP